MDTKKLPATILNALDKFDIEARNLGYMEEQGDSDEATEAAERHEQAGEKLIRTILNALQAAIELGRQEMGQP